MLELTDRLAAGASTFLRASGAARRLLGGVEELEHPLREARPDCRRFIWLAIWVIGIVN